VNQSFNSPAEFAQDQCLSGRSCSKLVNVVEKPSWNRGFGKEKANLDRSGGRGWPDEAAESPLVNFFSNVIEFAPSIDPCEFLDWKLKPHRGDQVKPGAVRGIPEVLGPASHQATNQFFCLK
jgi:hypothetical protein